MPSQKWLSWSPSHQKVLSSGQEGTDKTDKSPVLSVLSVLSVRGSRDNTTFDHSDPDVKASVPAAQPDLAIHRGMEVESRPENIPTSRTSRSDAIAVEALQEVADLLAVAYQRYRKIQRLPVNPPEDAVNRELAIPGGQSVHGGGQLQ